MSRSPESDGAFAAVLTRLVFLPHRFLERTKRYLSERKQWLDEVYVFLTADS
jgi:hypothetical protein